MIKLNRVESREQSNTTARESSHTVFSSKTARAISQKVSNTMIQKTAEQKATEQKVAKYSKLSFCDSSKHECDFNRASYNVESKLAFSVSDKKYYKTTDRIDILTMSREEVESRLSKVALFDRKSFEQAFDYEATFVIACNSKAVALNLCQHERKYSTLYRHLSLYSNRADLYLLCAMSNKQRATCFNSSLFLKAVSEQSKSLTVEQIQKATCSNKLYQKVAEQLKKLLIESKQTATAKTKTASIITAKTKTAKTEKALAK